MLTDINTIEKNVIIHYHTDFSQYQLNRKGPPSRILFSLSFGQCRNAVTQLST